MGAAPPAGCGDYDAVRRDPDLATACDAYYRSGDEDDWQSWTRIVPWSKIAMEIVVMLFFR